MTHSLIIAAVLGKVKANRSDAHMTAQNPPADPPRTTSEGAILSIVAAYAAVFVLFGLMLQSPAALFAGDILHDARRASHRLFSSAASAAVASTPVC
jgi:hypothetical protein